MDHSQTMALAAACVLSLGYALHSRYNRPLIKDYTRPRQPVLDIVVCSFWLVPYTPWCYLLFNASAL